MNHKRPHEPSRIIPNPQALWDDKSVNPKSFGCSVCVDHEICGGAHRGVGFYDCIDYCSCSDKLACDMVCRGNPANYVERVREVSGLPLDNVPAAPKIALEKLPPMLPLIERKTSRHGRLFCPVIALSLYDLIDLPKGTLKATNREELAQRFGIDPNARLVLSGVARDGKIERFWELPNRSELLSSIHSLGISLATTPNFSVLTDVPRTDNLHAIKRIALVWAEMAIAGLPTALHINARTEQDYSRWGDFIAARDEIQSIAFEFATGAGRGDRIDWHVTQLCLVAARANRPLHLVIRGGTRVLETLRKSYASVTLLDTDAYSRTLRRRQANFTEAGKLRWSSCPTDKGAPLDNLMAHNIATLHSYHIALERDHRESRADLFNQRTTITINRNQKPRHSRLLRKHSSSLGEPHSWTQHEGMVITPKT